LCILKGFAIFTFHMSGQDRRRLLRQWVESGCNPNAVEAQVVIERTQASTTGRQKELLSVGEMQAKGFPESKIRSIIARGGGIPDPDCPELAECTKFWVVTSQSHLEEEVHSQKASMAMAANADADFADGLYGSQMASGPGRATIGAEALNQLMTPSGQAGNAGHCIFSDLLSINNS
jgi:hypothetical protein